MSFLKRVSWSLSAADRETRWSNYGAFYGYFSSKEALFASIVENRMPLF